MAYTPHTWTANEVIDAAKLNANEQGTQAAAAAADTANTGLTSKVNSITYTAGLAGKADMPAGGTDGQALVKAGTTTTWATVSGGTTPDATSTVKGAVQLAGDLGGTAASPTVPGLAGKLTAASNLSDVASAATARTNLGLGTAATSAATAFDASGAATAAQAAAVQRANHTGTQAASTITGLATVATSGSYVDLTAKPTIPTVGAAGAGAAIALSSTDASVTNARTPTAHAATHASGGSDPITPAAIGASPTLVTQTQQSGAAYTFALTDAGTVVEFTNSSTVTATVPLNSAVAFPVGTTIVVRQYGTGQVTIAGTSGVALRSRGAALTLVGQYSEASLTKRSTDEWIISGDVTV